MINKSVGVIVGVTKAATNHATAILLKKLESAFL